MPSGASQGLGQLALLPFFPQFTCNLQQGKWLCCTLIMSIYSLFLCGLQQYPISKLCVFRVLDSGVHVQLLESFIRRAFDEVMHQSIESPGGGGGGAGWGGDSAPTFCTILHSPRPPRHIFLSLIPTPGAHFLKAHIHISSYESNKLQEQDAALLVLSVIP